MKTIKILSVLLLTGAMMTGCSNEENAESTNTLEAGKTYILSVNASKGDDANTTRALSLSGKTLNATWAMGEHVYVKEGSTTLGGSLSPDRDGSNARLNGAITGLTGSLPQDLTLLFPRSIWSYTEQKGTLENIAANYDYATATAHVDNIDGSNITATSSVTFANEQAIVKFNLQNSGGTSINASSLRISASGLKTNETEAGDITITPASATNEIFAALRGITSNTEVTLTAKVGSDTYVYKNASAKFEHGKYYAITVKMHQVIYPKALSEVTNDYIGSVIGANGNVYPNVTAATNASTTAVAMVAYVSSTGHGLALALANDGTQIFETAKTTVSGKTKVGDNSWSLPLQADWNNMITGCGGYDALNAKLVSAGSVALNGDYWAPEHANSAYTIYIDSNGYSYASAIDGQSSTVRACLSF